MKNTPDGRTKVGRYIREIKKLISSDLDAAAVKILERDIANLSVIAQLCFEKALKKPDQAMDSEGNLHPAMRNYLKFQGAVKSGLLAIKKFEQKKSGGIADFFEDED